MKSPETAVSRKPASTAERLAAIVFAALMILTGPVMIGIGTSMADTDEELARAGVQTTGTIIDFDDVRNASKRDIQVHYLSADGSEHSTIASVDRDQQPTVGDDVTVIYREDNPEKAIVVGYESDGISVRGIGTLFLLIFTPLGLILVFKGFRKRRKQRTA